MRDQRGQRTNDEIEPREQPDSIQHETNRKELRSGQTERVRIDKSMYHSPSVHLGRVFFTRPVVLKTCRFHAYAAFYKFYDRRRIGHSERGIFNLLRTSVDSNSRKKYAKGNRTSTTRSRSTIV